MVGHPSARSTVMLNSGSVIVDIGTCLSRHEETTPVTFFFLIAYAMCEKQVRAQSDIAHNFLCALYRLRGYVRALQLNTLY